MARREVELTDEEVATALKKTTQLNESQLFALIQSIQIQDPVLKDLLREFVKRQQVVYNELFAEAALPPIQEELPIPTVVGDVQVFNYELRPQGIYFTWERPSTNAVLFEIRYGDTWDTASRQLVTSTLSAVLPGREDGQTHKYWIKAQALDGTQSENATPLDVVIPAISLPFVSATVIDNFVLLSWPPVDSSFQIDYYLITRNGEEFGRIYGTFIQLFEVASGIYHYGVTAFDIFGNSSDEAIKDVEVYQPADYVLEDVETDDFTGIRNNVYRDARLPSIFAIPSTTETWGDYANNGWATMQDEINDDLPYWLQPTVSIGSYERVLDYGAVYNGVVVTVDWNVRDIAEGVSFSCYISTSVDNVTYSPEIQTNSMFVVSIRYVKLRFTFQSTLFPAGLIELYNVRARLDVRLELDAGQVNALASDTLGTPVLFNKAFKDIRSITVSAESPEITTVVYNFVDEPNPQGFEVYAYRANARVDCLVSWKAQGVL